MAQCINLEITKKTTKVYELIFTNKKTGLAEDLTGWSFYFYIKEKMSDTDVDAKLAKVITGASITSPLLGKTLITLTTSDTDIEVKSYYFSIDYKDDEDTPNQGVLISGRIKIAESLIKDRS